MEGTYEAVVREGRRLRGYVRMLGRPCYPADDLMQETYLQAFKSLQGRDLPENPGGWLKRIAQWTAWRQVREAESYAAREVEDARRADVVLEPLEALVFDEDTRRLQQALEHLSDRDQKLLQDYYWDSIGCSEIARELGTSRHAIKVRLYRARNRLRKVLG